MARLSREQYLQLISDFVWANLNKEITGPVLRQFIVNILDSTAEMHLLDGTSIEKAIQELRNRAGGGAVGDTQFSEQFKIVEDVVWMNLKMITANGVEEPDEPAPAPLDIPIKIDTAKILESAPSANIETDVLVYERENGGRYSGQSSYAVEFPNGLTLDGDFGGENFKVLELDLEKLGYFDLASGVGNNFRVSADFKVNQQFYDSFEASRINGAGFVTNPYSGGYAKSALIGLYWDSFYKYGDWYYDLFDHIYLQLQLGAASFDPMTLLPGSMMEICNIKIERL
jgi:hypothetical protein